MKERKVINENSSTIEIPMELYTSLIESKAYAMGKLVEIEKQLKERNGPIELMEFENFSKRDNQYIINNLEMEIRRLKSIYPSEDEEMKPKEILEYAKKRIDGKIEGLQFAIDFIKK